MANSSFPRSILFSIDASLIFRRLCDQVGERERVINRVGGGMASKSGRSRLCIFQLGETGGGGPN